MPSICTRKPTVMEYSWDRALSEWLSKNLSRTGRRYSRQPRFAGNEVPSPSRLIRARPGLFEERQMALVPFNDLMNQAEKGGYAVGYFESWNLESIQAVADAAESMRSPVILGFSGIYLPHPSRTSKERLSVYAALGLETCRS